MKKYGILLTVTGVAIALIVGLAQIFAPAPIEVVVVPVKEVSVESDEICAGVLEETARTEVHIETPVIASSVKVRVGQRVQAGQALIEVDEASTRAVIAYSGLASLPSLSELAQTGLTQSVSGAVPKEASVPKVITAPAAGTVTNIAVKAGEIASPGKSIVTISDLSCLEVKITIPEDKIADIQLGQKATITGKGFRGREYRGEVIDLSPSAYKRLSGTTYETVVDAIVSIDEPDSYLKPNFNVSVCLQTPQRENTIAVPYSAVRQDEDGTEYVYLYRHAQAWRADIMTGMEWNETVEVVEGLKSGDNVIINPDDKMKNGAHVIMTGEAGRS